jgi:FkbM family methyltransferase
MSRPSFPIHQGLDPFERLRSLVGPAKSGGLVRSSHSSNSARSAGSVTSIVDGGANKGRTVARFLEMFPDAAIRAFEPSPRLARKLAKHFAAESRVVVRPVALGAFPGHLALNVLESQTCSSLLAPTGIRDKHPGKPMGVSQTVPVEVVRLDQELPEAPDIIKLDLQGYELEALRGAEGLLGGVEAVLCEVSFTDLYRNQPLGDDVIAWMRRKGFGLEGLYSPWYDGAGGLVSADALFLCKA